MPVPDRIVATALNPAEQDILDLLWAQLRLKTPRNVERARYYDGKNAFRQLGISTPPNLRQLEIVLGWSAKAVDVLARRCKLEGFTVPGVDDTSDIDDIWTTNALASEATQAGVSSLIHATAFLGAIQGDTAAGEPPVLITARDALSGTGRWDRRRRRLTAFLSVVDTTDDGAPTDLVLYLDRLNLILTRTSTGWAVERRPHRWEVPVEPLVYRPRLSRPFGSSRISRAVMSLHDSALRTVLRSEITAELYSVPQRVLLGADEGAFRNADGTLKTAWQAIMGRVWAIPDSDDPGAANPRVDIKEFTSATQDPHVAQLRAWAQLFAGETSIPISSLGISTEANPASADAWAASREDLIAEAEGTTDDWGPAWRRTMIRALAMRDGKATDDVAPELTRLSPKWRSPSTPSRAAAADAAGKTLDKFPWLADSDLGLELYGLPDDFIRRAMAERRRQGGTAALRAITEAAAAGRPAVTVDTP